MGRTYVMSDIHGMADLFKRMLEQIRFSDEDTLYIIGDMIDRGPDPEGILDFVMSHKNVTALRGNHEDGFTEWYDNVEDKVHQRYYYNTYDVLTDCRATRGKLPEYVRFMKSLPLYRKVKMNGNCYLMAHASTEEILRVWKRKERLLWDTSLIDRQRGIPGYVSIVGHVPTFIIRGYPKEPAAVWHSPDGRIIDVDCGAAFGNMGGRLGCLCLDTGEEYYESSLQDHR